MIQDTHESDGKYTYYVEYAKFYNWFHASVYYDGLLIARKSCAKDHKRAGKWAVRQIKSHKKALALVEGAK